MASNVETLISFIGKDNIVDDVLDMEDGENILMKLGRQVVETAERDVESMSEWSNMVEEGQKIAKQETAAKNDPWPGASNYKDPAILEAAIAFGDRASTELLRGNLAKGEVIGNDTEGNKRAAVDRVITFLNWQLNHQMRGWREDHRRLLYQLPLSGTVFKRTFFDPMHSKPKSELVHYPNFAVNQATTNLEEATFSIYLDVDVNGVFERQSSGLWADVQIYPEKAEGDEGSNADEEVDFSFDNPEKFIQQDCFFDLDDDGYQEPYTVTVHENTQKVVRIVARYKENNILVSLADNNIVRLEFGDDGAEGDLVKIDASSEITKYGFINDPEGTYLDIGYYHLLSSLTKAINATKNLLTDEGVLANMGGGFVAKGFRKKMGNLRIKPGEWQSTDIGAQDLQSGMMPYPLKEPSPTLLNLNMQLEERVKTMTANTDLKGVLAPNAPATTTLGILSEAQIPLSAILQHIIDAESEEFRKIFLLDSEFTTAEDYQKILDDQEADFESDFDIDNMDISPTANADLSSKMQRLQQAEALVLQAPNIALEGGQTQWIWEMYFDALGIKDGKGKSWPTTEEMAEEQQQQAAQAEQQQQQQAQDKARVDDLEEREMKVKELEATADVEKTASDLDLNDAKIIKTLEEAETEATNNKVTKYTASVQQQQVAVDQEVVAQAADRLDREEDRKDNDERRKDREVEIKVNVGQTSKETT